MSELSRVRHWADALIRLHLDATWTFDFDHAKRRAGLCNFSEKRITVSRYLAGRYEDDEVHQILLHEVAHALAGPAAGHGPKWKATARELGYVGKRLHDGAIASELAPWVGTCPADTCTTATGNRPGRSPVVAARRDSARPTPSHGRTRPPHDWVSPPHGWAHPPHQPAPERDPPECEKGSRAGLR